MKSTRNLEVSALPDVDSPPTHESDDRRLPEELQGTTGYDRDRHLLGTIESTQDLWTIGEGLAHQLAKLGKATPIVMSPRLTQTPLPDAHPLLFIPAELRCIRPPKRGQGVVRSHLAIPMEMIESHTAHQMSIRDHFPSVNLDTKMIENSRMTARQCLLPVRHAVRTISPPLHLELPQRARAHSARLACQ